MRKLMTVGLLGLGLLTLGTDRAQSGETLNEKAVRDLFAAIDRGDVERFRELVADDAVLHPLGATEVLSRDAVLGAMKEFYAAFPDNTHVIEQMVAAGDRVAVMLTARGTSKGPYEGVPPTGQTVTVAAMHIIKFDGGRVHEWWVLEDTLGFMRQLGMELKARTPGP